ncbi:DUF4282 domain-containing protein [bacterium AH-315-J19]|nr:DUF4282 domain-containing protein [Robiginitomaculum sp.]MBN4058409.1 DUF4282 domain-containing protein [bacterium AH-315-J19]
MLDLFKQFFSFKKLMKDRLVAAFFFLGLVVVVVSFLSTLGSAFAAFGNGFFIGGLGLFLAAFFKILFLFVTLRLVSELMIAIFHINNNLSPDGGKSDTADIDVFETTREAATKAAKSASSATKSAYEKTKTKLAERSKDDDEDYPDYEDVTPPKRKKPVARKPAVKKTAAKKPAAKKPTTRKTTAKKPTPRKTPPKK